MIGNIIVRICWPLLAFASAAAAFDVEDASEFCFSLKSHRNPKDMYADADNCHNFIQCRYINATYAVGSIRPCPAHSFFHEPVLSCIPEGDVACVDRCLDDAVAAKGGYAGVGCRQYFRCSNTGSYGMCCPAGTEFNFDRFSCDMSETCDDPCEQTAPEVKTTVAPSRIFNATVCIDSFGTAIMTDGDLANAFHIVDAEGQSTGKTFCVVGMDFNLASCRCDIESEGATPEPTSYRKVSFYQPFDEDLNDHSVHNFQVTVNGDVAVDNENFAVGTGSALFTGSGFLEIAGIKTNSYQEGMSHCAFYKCNGKCTGTVVEMPGTALCGFDDAGVFNGRFHYVAPENIIDTPPWKPAASALLKGEWNHMCLTLDNNQLKVYMNGNLEFTSDRPGVLKISQNSFTYGNSQTYGYFDGNIDETLLAHFEMTAEEVAAHYNGDMDYLRQQGFF